MSTMPTTEVTPRVVWLARLHVTDRVPIKAHPYVLPLSPTSQELYSLSRRFTNTTGSTTGAALISENRQQRPNKNGETTPTKLSRPLAPMMSTLRKSCDADHELSDGKNGTVRAVMVVMPHCPETRSASEDL